MKVTTKVRTLRTLAVDAGITIDSSRGKGSHELWIREGCVPFTFTPGHGKECSMGVARKAVAFIEGRIHAAF